MPDEETIEGTLSEETTEVEETPSELPETETPAQVETETTENPVEPTEPVQPELYELPDGRKVTGVEVAQEYKNLLADYTKKSQALAEKEKGNEIINAPEKPYENPEWQPQTYDELLKIAEERVLTTLEQKEKAKIEAQQALENTVVSQLTEIKQVDPNINEGALFQHATKYGFKDLKLAHQNMKDMSEMVKKVQSTTATNIAKRNDPVSVNPGATGQRPDPSQFENARDYLRALQN